jgi:hypothetical protein
MPVLTPLAGTLSGETVRPLMLVLTPLAGTLSGETVSVLTFSWKPLHITGVHRRVVMHVAVVIV